MKIRIVIVVMLFGFAFTASGQTIPDEIRTDYTAVKKELGQVLWDLSRNTGVNIAFSKEKIQADSLVSISVKNETLGSILNSLFVQSDLKYEIVGNQLVIKRDEFVNVDKIITLSGMVEDAQSGEPLIYANLYLLEQNIGTETNEAGNYSLTVRSGVQRLYVSYLGYKKTILELKLKKDSTLNISLEPESLLNEILILDEDIVQIEKSLSSSSELPIDQIRSIATLGGEPDVIRLAQMMPGVSTGADGFGGINVRGGSADQNLILYDGVPVYNTGHALGIFSVFNSSTIKSAQLMKGAIPARFGGRLSSVMDIRTKDGNYKKTGGEFSLGALAFKGTLEGPIVKDKSSFLISYRRTILDPWIKGLTEYINEFVDKEGFAEYHFYDVNAKINFRLNDKNKLAFSFYRGRDLFDNNVKTFTNVQGLPTEELNQDNWSWGNQLFVAKWNSRISDKLFTNLTAYQTKFDFASFDHQRFEEQDTFFQADLFKSKISDLGIKLDFDYLPNPSNYIKFGVSAIQHQFNPGLINRNEGSDNVDNSLLIKKEDLDDILEEADISNLELIAFLEDELKIGNYLTVNLGVHASSVRTNSKSYTSIQPRFAFIAKADDVWFKGGISRMNQYLHLLSNSGLGLPTDVWIPSTDRIAPEQSWIYTLGAGIDFGKGLIGGVEGFYKVFENVVSYNEGVLSPINSTNDWDQNIPIGTGNSYGIEVSLDKKLGKTLWFANYTVSLSNRKFRALNAGTQFPFRYDRRHQIKLTFIRKLTENAEFSLNWTYGTGNPLTVPYELIRFTDENGVARLIPIYREKNNELLPDYHRFDIGFNFYNDYSFGRQKFTIGLFNAYNRKNPFYLELRRNVDKPERFEYSQYSLLPILPSLSYSLSF